MTMNEQEHQERLDLIRERNRLKADLATLTAQRDRLAGLLRESVTCFNGLYLEQKSMRERINATLKEQTP